MRASVTVAQKAHNLQALGSIPKPASRIEKITNRAKSHGLSTKDNHRIYTKAKNIIRHNWGMRVSDLPDWLFNQVYSLAEAYLTIERKLHGHKKDQFRNLVEGIERNRIRDSQRS